MCVIAASPRSKALETTVRHKMNETNYFRPMSKSELARVLVITRTNELMHNYVTEQMLENTGFSWELYKRKRVLPARLIKLILERELITPEMAEQRLSFRTS